MKDFSGVSGNIFIVVSTYVVRTYDDSQNISKIILDFSVTLWYTIGVVIMFFDNKAGCHADAITVCVSIHSNFFFTRKENAMDAEKAHGNPGAQVNPVSTNQVKLDKNPSPVKVEYMKMCHESREYIGKLPVGEDDKGAPKYVGKNWAVAHALICLMHGLQEGEVTWEKVLSWFKPPKAAKAKNEAKPKNAGSKPAKKSKAAKPSKAKKPAKKAAKKSSKAKSKTKK